MTRSAFKTIYDAITRLSAHIDAHDGAARKVGRTAMTPSELSDEQRALQAFVKEQKTKRKGADDTRKLLTEPPPPEVAEELEESGPIPTAAGKANKPAVN